MSPLRLRNPSPGTRMCPKKQGHTGGHDPRPSLWNQISQDPDERTRKKIVKAGYDEAEVEDDRTSEGDTANSIERGGALGGQLRSSPRCS